MHAIVHFKSSNDASAMRNHIQCINLHHAIVLSGIAFLLWAFLIVTVSFLDLNSATSKNTATRTI